jgi:hypothetical protein
MFAAFNPSYFLLSTASRSFLTIPLVAACLSLVIALSVAASRSYLHIPGYVGLAFGTFAAAMVAGHFSGGPRLIGTPLGVALSMLFFLLISVTVGSILALFFYRHPEV